MEQFEGGSPEDFRTRDAAGEGAITPEEFNATFRETAADLNAKIEAGEAFKEFLYDADNRVTAVRIVDKEGNILLFRDFQFPPPKKSWTGD